MLFKEDIISALLVKVPATFNKAACCAIWFNIVVIAARTSYILFLDLWDCTNALVIVIRLYDREKWNNKGNRILLICFVITRLVVYTHDLLSPPAPSLLISPICFNSAFSCLLMSFSSCRISFLIAFCHLFTCSVGSTGFRNMKAIFLWTWGPPLAQGGMLVGLLFECQDTQKSEKRRKGENSSFKI